MTDPLRVTHIITDLDMGGAEMMLYKLLSALDPKEFSSRVISLTNIGSVGERIRTLGVPVDGLGMRPGFPRPMDMFRLAHLLRDGQPQVVQTWMYHADLLGGLVTRLAQRPPLVWNIRNSVLNPTTSKRSTYWTVHACARFSRRWPVKIVSCSDTALKLHAGLGYAADRMLVIPNGFDLSLFRPDASARKFLRTELELPPETVLIGAVGRFDPQKDYLTMIEAAGLLHAERQDVHFVLCGEGLTNENQGLMAWITANGLQSVFHLLGRRTDVPAITAALDLATSSSAYGEAFSNVLGEAMACGVPFVATDVGDAAAILGKTGKVVLPRDPEALVAAWLELLSLPAEERAALGAAARQRIEDNFSLPAVAGQYAALYRELAAAGGR
ncbi:MAG: glycosyltransferase [Anaerolineaceae bacterium]|nr:glycosyltransferase [Anaerolineaceae bacterium]